MKVHAWLAAAALLGYSLFFRPQAPDRDVLIVTGSLFGNLSPCGCTKPMSGGILRRVTAIRQLTVKGRTTVIESGGIVGGAARQDEMKAEAVAETMKLVNVAAINYGLEEARLGAGMAFSMGSLSGGALVASGLTESDLPVQRFKRSGPFLIGGIDPRARELGAAARTQVQAPDETADALLEEARSSRLVPVLMVRGDLETSKELAKKHPALRLIVCDLKSSPLDAPAKVGETLIVGAGENGKNVVRLEWDGKGFVGYKSYDLGPEYADDKDAQAVYASYLGRVDREDLLAMVPRSDTPLFAGNKLCGSCHTKAYNVWLKSDHSHALSTLEKQAHGRDPDCVVCHVVGLGSTFGFFSRAKTLQLTDVGCESCHGPGKDHAMKPYTVEMPKAGADACLKCHVTEHSPGFDFTSYWEKIKH